MKRLIALCAAAALGLIVQTTALAGEHAAVGSEKCKICHKIQFESWAKSKHALAQEKTTCESCHGNGGDYFKLAVMKDPAKAKEAGLIAKPDKASCLLKCHKPAQIKDEMLLTTHEHKPKK